jgi:hypothetical protein
VTDETPQKWTQEAVDLFDEYGTLSEFNGGTYAGVTLFAMSLAQYLPKNTTLYKEAPRLMAAIWEQIGEPKRTVTGGSADACRRDVQPFPDNLGWALG